MSVWRDDNNKPTKLKNPPNSGAARGRRQGAPCQLLPRRPSQTSPRPPLALTSPAPASLSPAFKGRSGAAGLQLPSAAARLCLHLPAAGSPARAGSRTSPPARREQVPGLLAARSRPQPPAARPEVGPGKGAHCGHMESGGGTAPAGALGAAAESPPCPLSPGAEGAAGPAEPDGAAEGAGSGGGGEDGGGPRRALRAVYVRSESPQGGAAGGLEAGARQCLLRACEAEGAQFISVPFGELDFGETAVLDAFYDAGEAAAPFALTPPYPLS